MAVLRRNDFCCTIVVVKYERFDDSISSWASKSHADSSSAIVSSTVAITRAV